MVSIWRVGLDLVPQGPVERERSVYSLSFPGFEMTQIRRDVGKVVYFQSSVKVSDG